MELQQELQSIWSALLTPFQLDHNVEIDFWKEIKTAYSGRSRHYHNLEHLKYMLTKAQLCEADLKDKEVLYFAIFYHDIIYNVNRQDNEERSAKLAAERLTQIGLSAERVNKCHQQIVATKKHESADSDTNFLLDFDLAILGDSPKNYLQYTKNIRKEYAVYPGVLYRKGRRKVLQHFLRQDRIFKKDFFYNKYEQQARQNLKQELDQL